MSKSLFLLGVSAGAALAAATSFAAPAQAMVDSVGVHGATPGAPCRVDVGCSIIATLTGSDSMTPVEFIVAGTSLGTATPSADSNGKVTATLLWNPPKDGLYAVQVKQNGTADSISYYVSNNGQGICGWLPSGSGTGSGGSGSGTGSAGSGSADSGSGTGSGGTGSGGTGSGGTGSGC